MLRTLLFKNRLWKNFKKTSLYYWLTDPVGFSEYKIELGFYKDLLQKHPEKDNLIFDVGANMGRKSFLFSKLVKQTVAFEPGERLYKFLLKRFQGSNVVVLNYALGRNETRANYYLLEENQAYNSLSEKHLKTTATKKGIAIKEATIKEVQVKTLENFICEYGTPKYIKIDVEGYEEEVINGLKNPVPIISFEVNLPEFSKEMENILDYLDKISSGRYLYNFSIENSFGVDEFLRSECLKNIISRNSFGYLEIFAVLKN